jgi:hypothetical protein
MNEQAQNLDGIIVAGRLPINGPVWVQCDGYRCLAVLDRNGTWKSFFDGKELTDFVNVCAAQKEQAVHLQANLG